MMGMSCAFAIANRLVSSGGNVSFQGMNPRIAIQPDVCHGKPVIRGTRVLVSTLLGALSSGSPISEILEDYPNVTEADVHAALELASQLSDYQTSAYDAVA